ncbi:MAG: argC [bacterium]|nr:MAG: argC [bacterium]
MTRNFAGVDADTTVSVAFAPALAPMSRGILATVSTPMAAPIDEATARELWIARYADEPFVTLLAAGEWPETRGVCGTNRVQVAVSTVHGGRTLLATAAIDNLVKGAAGQAIQNLNLMCGWPETTGLEIAAQPW